MDTKKKYISLERAVNFLTAQAAQVSEAKWRGMARAIGLLYEVPTAKVRDDVTARWTFSEYDYFDCSACGGSYYNGCNSSREALERLEKGADLYKFCPHCGAQMENAGSEGEV